MTNYSESLFSNFMTFYFYCTISQRQMGFLLHSTCLTALDAVFQIAIFYTIPVHDSQTSYDKHLKKLSK